MPIRIKPASASADKYTRNTGSARQSFIDGINNMRRDWATVTAASESAWEGGIQAAISSKSFQNGITADAAAKQKNNAINLGADRYGPGTKNAVPAWVKFTQPVLDAMAQVADMPRGPKMSQQNFDKQHAFAAAAHSAKKNK